MDSTGSAGFTTRLTLTFWRIPMSYFGIEAHVDGEWALIHAADTSFQQLLNEAKTIAKGYLNYRVRRLAEEEYLDYVVESRGQPGFPCPNCASPLAVQDEKLHCQICNTTITQTTTS